MNIQYHTEQLIRIDNLIRNVLIGTVSNQQIKEAITFISPDLAFILSGDLRYATTIQIYSEALHLLKALLHKPIIKCFPNNIIIK